MSRKLETFKRNLATFMAQRVRAALNIDVDNLSTFSSPMVIPQDLVNYYSPTLRQFYNRYAGDAMYNADQLCDILRGQLSDAYYGLSTRPVINNSWTRFRPEVSLTKEGVIEVRLGDTTFATIR